MKVLDLQCGQQHVFEGWFASEDDFLSQHARHLVACPLCGDETITRKLSAPRLNLGVAAPTTQALLQRWLMDLRSRTSHCKLLGSPWRVA